MLRPLGDSAGSSSVLSTGLRLRRSVRSGWMMVYPDRQRGAQRFLSSPRPSCLRRGGRGAGTRAAAGTQLLHIWQAAASRATLATQQPLFASCNPAPRSVCPAAHTHFPRAPAVAAAPDVQLAILADGGVVPVSHRHAHNLLALRSQKAGAQEAACVSCGRSGSLCTARQQ